MKKLLILGANPETVPLIETAKKLGVYTIVTDNDPNAPAKKFADKGININGMDVDALVEFCREENVDGVLVGVADRLIEPYQKVCKILELPCYCNEYQCKVLTNKDEFNIFCEENNIPVIPHFDIDSPDITFPVVVKPVDSNSGKGLSICNSYDELKIAIPKAKKVSKQNKILIEKYMDCDDMFLYYTFRNGECMLSAIADRYTYSEKDNLGKVCVGAIYPSKHEHLYFEKFHNKILSAFKKLNIKDGVLLISAFVDNKQIYLYDPGFRLQGEAPNIHLETICEYDQKAMLIEFALGKQMGKLDLKELIDYKFNGIYASTLWILSKAGTIKEIYGFEEAQNDLDVHKIVQRLFKGDIVPENSIGTEAQVIARIYLKANTKTSLIEKIDYYSKNIKIIDNKNQNMLLATLNNKML
jgi:biotin carboxylase